MINKKLLFVILTSTLTFASCSNNSFSDSKNGAISVTLIDSQHYSIVSHDAISSKNKNIVYLKENQTEVNYVLHVDTDYLLSSTDYGNSFYFFIGEGNYSLSLSNIKHSVRVGLSFEKIKQDDSSSYTSGSDIDYSESSSAPISSSEQPYVPLNQITYDSNGGEYILYNGQKMNMSVYSLSHHPRPNTSIGTNIMKRDGYTLYGWNNKKDGSGEHIGLGSRYLDLSNNTFTLYAEWAQFSKANLFEYSINELNNIKITKYLGQEETVCVPEFINDLPVTIIGSDAFLNSGSKVVILPKSIKTIEEHAFNNCQIEELYFYDNVIDITDNSFKDCSMFSTIHINAIEAPRYVTADRHSTYADKIDNLIVNQGKKKLVIAGGSGAYYSIDACELKRLYPSYEPFNVALNGSFSNYIQFDILNHYLESGDVLLHAVESCGSYQFMKLNSMANIDDIGNYDCRFMNAFELNYDLLSLTDIRKTTNLFDIFAAFNASRINKQASDYTSYTYFADKRGDYSSDPALRSKSTPHAVYDENNNIIKPAAITEEGAIDRTCYSKEGFEALSNYYNNFSNNGIDVYFVFSCLNKGSLLASEIAEENVLGFEEDVREGLGGSISIINRLADVLYDASCFSDSDWHLDYEHALSFTKVISNWLGGI